VKHTKEFYESMKNFYRYLIVCMKMIFYVPTLHAQKITNLL